MPVTECFEQLFTSILEDRDIDAFMDCWAGDADITMWGSDLHERAIGRWRWHTFNGSVPD